MGQINNGQKKWAGGHVHALTMRQFFLALLITLLCGTQASAEVGRPNILFIIFDDWNGSTHAGAYGCDWVKTPNFDRIAREGALFSNAFTSNPKCNPCRASILTGRKWLSVPTL